MERRSIRRSFSFHSAIAPGRNGAHPSRSARWHRRHYEFERLEDRLAMDGDNSLAADLVTPATNDEVVVARIDETAPTIAPLAIDELPEQFQSAAELEQWLIDTAVEQWGHLFGQTTNYPYPWGWPYPVLFEVDGLAVPRVMAFNDLAAASDGFVSDTNVQVEGVDEADLIETDGDYLYILSGNDLVIVEAGIGDELRVAARVHLEEKLVGMYLDGDRLALVSTTAGSYDIGDGIGDGMMLAADIDSTRSSDHYNVPTTTVTILDVTDRSAPKLVQKSQMDGQLVASRVVDGELRLVLNNSLYLPPPIAKPIDGEAEPDPDNGGLANSMLVTDIWYPPSDGEYVYETQQEYLGRVKDDILKSAMPGLRVLDLQGEVSDERLLVDATDVHRPDSPHDRMMTTVATFDLSNNEAGPSDAVSVFTQTAAQVYATADSIYLFSQGGYYSSPLAIDFVYSRPTTAIRKFDFDGDTHAIKYAARGEVDGPLLNQFAADEHDGYLRVVTTPDWGSGQSVSVLQQNGNRLEVIGSIDGIAPGERLHSVRFMGERAFVVTFRQIDPLFALDLSDPTNPLVMGELKIPGVSGYLQPVDESHLLGVGRNADPENGLFNELQVSLFDIADLTDPQLLHQYSFDGGWTTFTPILGDAWVPVLGEHHAVSYFPNEQILAIPINSKDGGTLHGVAETPIFEPGQGGLQVFQIDVEAGFTPLAMIQHDTLIERSLHIGEHLFAISSGTVTVHALSNPADPLGELTIAAESVEPFVELVMYQPVTVGVGYGPIGYAPPGRPALQDRPQIKSQYAYRPSARDAIASDSALTEGFVPAHRSGPVQFAPARQTALARNAVFAASGDLLLVRPREEAVQVASNRGWTPARRESSDAALERFTVRREWVNFADVSVVAEGVLTPSGDVG